MFQNYLLTSIFYNNFFYSPRWTISLNSDYTSNFRCYCWKCHNIYWLCCATNDWTRMRGQLCSLLLEQKENLLPVQFLAACSTRSDACSVHVLDKCIGFVCLWTHERKQAEPYAFEACRKGISNDGGTLPFRPWHTEPGSRRPNPCKSVLLTARSLLFVFMSEFLTAARVW